MPKKKRVWTEEQKQAARERWAARNAKVQAAEAPEQTPTGVPAPQEAVKTGEDDPKVILARALEAIEMLAKLQANTTGQSTGVQLNQGRVTGTLKKYSLDPADYPDPSERLSQEPKLQQFAFPMNYELKYTIQTAQYETKAGITYTEPQFVVELWHLPRDPATGDYQFVEREGKRLQRKIRASGLTFFEDPSSALVIARQNGIDPEQYGGEQTFLNEMRYLVVRDWLFEQFYPPRNTSSDNTKEMVVGGKLVEYKEVSIEEGTTAPNLFSGLNKKF